MIEFPPMLERGIYEHYKHHLYEAHGVGMMGRQTGHEPGYLKFFGIAHYSEDPTRRFVVMSIVEPDSWLQFVVYELVTCDRPPLDLTEPLAIYTALYTNWDDDTPRLAVRPLEGKNGFNTPTTVRRHRVLRFRRLGRRRPNRAPGHVVSFPGATYCNRCGRRANSPIT